MNERLKQLLEELGVRQTALSRDIGISESNMRGILTGRTKSISGEVLVALQEKYNVNPIWVIRGEGSMFLSDSASETRAESRPIPQQPAQLPVCRTTEQCLDSITDENIHQTRWFKELSPTRQHIVAAVNTPQMSEAVCVAAKSLFTGFELGQKESDPALYKKGEAG